MCKITFRAPGESPSVLQRGTQNVWGFRATVGPLLTQQCRKLAQLRLQMIEFDRLGEELSGTEIERGRIYQV